MRRVLCLCAAIALPCCAVRADEDVSAAYDLETGLSRCDYWAGIERHPAVVNPVGRGDDPNVLSLRGEWDFSPSVHAGGKRLREFRTQASWTGQVKVRVPGCWEASGVGEPGRGQPILSDDNSPKDLRHVHVGEGYYRRTVALPAAWRGKRIWLKVGGVRSVGWFFVNDHPVAMVDAYAGQFKYDVTSFVEAGKPAKVVAVVDNAVASRSGNGICNRWGGLVRDVEFEATPDVCIDDVWVRGDFDKRLAEAHVEIAGLRELRSPEYSIRVSVENEVAELPLFSQPSQPTQPSQPSQLSLKVPLRDFRPWSPEHPNLYWATVELLDGDKVMMVRRERFGVRKFEVRGKEFYLNGKPFFIRGCGDNQAYPLTGVSPADRAYHLEHLKVAKAAGFNFIRLHTHAEMPEYFEAADELGIMLQPEIPYYYDLPNDHFSYDPVRDAVDRWKAFRRYPSFCVNSQGNEGLLGPGADGLVYRLLKRIDPDRLTIGQDGYKGSPETDYLPGPFTSWKRGAFNPDKPFVCHEFLNLTVKTDSRAEKDYTGLWKPPMTRADRAQWLAKSGLDLTAGDLLQDAQHNLQGLWAKTGVEIARADPYCDGFCYWTVTDTTVYNPETGCFTAQGLFDPFWRRKPGSWSAEEFGRFNAPSCVLLNEGVPTDEVRDEKVSFNPWSGGSHWPGTNRVHCAGETFKAEFLLSHYGEAALAGAVLEWRLVAGADVLASGRERLGRQELGPARRIATVDVPVPPLAKPVQAKLEASVVSADGARLGNAWDQWLFPRQSRAEVLARAASAGVVIAAEGSVAATEAIASARPLVTLANQDTPANFKLGWWWIGKQCGTAVRPHPALAGFPCGRFLSQVFFRIIREGTPLPVAGVAQDDLIVFGEGGKACYLYLAEKRHSNGARQMMVSGLDLSSDTPEGTCLLGCLVDCLSTRPIRIACIGDSITYGYHQTDRERTCYPRQLQDLLDERAPGRFEVRNFGNPGRGIYLDTMRGKEKRGFKWMKEHADALAWKPDIVISNLGINDVEEYPQEATGTREAGRFRREYEALLGDYLGSDRPPRLFIWTKLGPLAPPHKLWGDKAVQAMETDLARIAAETGAVSIDMLAPFGKDAADVLQKDGIHPTPAGAAIIARATLKALESDGRLPSR